MHSSKERDKAFINILQSELIVATGCTEPISVAYAAARARKLLNCEPESTFAEISGNVLKNVKSVVVPNSGGRRGIAMAIALGAVAGDAESGLQVLASVSESDIARALRFAASTPLVVSCPDSEYQLDISITFFGGGHSSKVRIVREHTNVILEEFDAKPIYKKNTLVHEKSSCDECLLNFEDILDFAQNSDISPVRDLLQRQLKYNTAIAAAGIDYFHSTGIGRMLMGIDGSVRMRARAMAAAGSDARMNGCELPVVIVSGSGNQGIAASLPVAEYARELDCNEDLTLRALALSDLITIYCKRGIGKLSAFCGVVCAGCGAGAAITWLRQGDARAIESAVVNTLALSSGIICDGAKSSCAGKISLAVEAGLIGCEMALNRKRLKGSDGIVADSADETISNISRIASEGMLATDRVIIDIMLGCPGESLG